LIDDIESNIVIGSYPESEDDVQKLKSKGVTAVLNLQTDQEIEKRKIDEA
jgi:hypothetical protein